MGRVAIGWIAVGALVMAASGPCAAQDSSESDMSYGYLGASLAHAAFDGSGCVGGASCGTSANAMRIFAGAWNDRSYGLEMSYVNFGKVARNGGDTRAQGFSASFLAGLPAGDRAIFFAKVGALFSFSSVHATTPGAATGNDRGPGFSLGAGAQLDLNRQWALRADWDLYRVAFAGRTESVKAWSIGAAFKF